jgi:hypothetical protein
MATMVKLPNGQEINLDDIPGDLLKSAIKAKGGAGKAAKAEMAKALEADAKALLAKITPKIGKGRLVLAWPGKAGEAFELRVQALRPRDPNKPPLTEKQKAENKAKREKAAKAKADKAKNHK